MKSKPEMLWDFERDAVTNLNESARSLLIGAPSQKDAIYAFEELFRGKDLPARLADQMVREGIALGRVSLVANPQSSQEFLLHCTILEENPRQSLLTLLPAPQQVDDGVLASNKEQNQRGIGAQHMAITNACGLFALAPDGTIIGWDDVCCGLFGLDYDQAYGKHFEELQLSVNEQPIRFEHLLSNISDIGIWRDTAWVQHTRTPVEFNASFTSFPGTTGTAVLICCQNAMPHLLEYRKTTLGRKLRTVLDRQRTPQQVLNELVRLLCESFEAEHSWLWRLASTGGKRSYQVEAEAFTRSYAHPPLSNIQLSSEEIESFLSNLPTEPVREMATSFQSKRLGKEEVKVASSFLLVKLLYNRGETWLLLLERSGRAHAWNTLEKELLTQISDVIVLAVENSQINAQLIERANYLNNIINSADLGILVIDLTGQNKVVSMINNRLCNDLNLQRSEIEGLLYRELKTRIASSHRDWRIEEQKLDELISNPSLERMDEVVINGQIMQRYSAPTRDQNGEIFGRMFLFRDVTQDRQIEHQLLHSQKMDSIGTLAGGVAHDFNNLLTTIQGYTELLKKDLDKDSSAFKKLLHIERGANRAAELTRNLLTFTRFNPGVLKVFDINDILRETQGILRSSIPTTIDLTLNFFEVPVFIEGDPTQIQQSIINLALNARDAISESGSLTVSVYIGCDPREGNAESAVPWAILEVSDTGCGISKEILPRIFEPFFTTKEVGKGTGLGLANVYGIVKKHDGFIDVASAVNQGTTFSIFLPLTSKAPPTELNAEDAAPEESSESLYPIHIFVVDDEADLREFCIAGLGDFCLGVCTASNGEEALQLLESQSIPEIDLVLLDLTMPKMSGKECFRMMRRRYPDLPIIICSGYSIESAARELLNQGALAFLPKPYNLTRLREVIEEVLPSILAKKKPEQMHAKGQMT